MTFKSFNMSTERTKISGSQQKLNFINKVPATGAKTEISNLLNVQDELTAAAVAGSTYRLWTRTVVIVAVGIVVYFYTKRNQETIFANAADRYPMRMQKFKCSPNYAAQKSQFALCVPQKCGRFVTDVLVETKETELLRDMAQRIIGKGGGSRSEEFGNLYQSTEITKEFSFEQLRAYKFVKDKIKLAIAEQFDIPEKSLFLTSPTFFSRLTNMTAKIGHDHVDKDTYPSFHYTAIVYLTTYARNFQAGRFIFADGLTGLKPTTVVVEQKAGRVNAFTSGSENRHRVEVVTSGESLDLTISFTCNEKLAVSDPQILNQNTL